MKLILALTALLTLTPLTASAAEPVSKTNARKTKAVQAGDHAPSKAGGSTIVPPDKSASGSAAATGGTGVPAPADMSRTANEELSGTASTGGTGTTLDQAGEGSKSNTTGKQ